ncbi:MAG: cation-transporting P-type ATPase [Rhodothermales bacterium]|nr:cation-transporting P-type ATPase [Rhodothermales bacterium]
MESRSLPGQPWSMPEEEVAAAFAVQTDGGLSPVEVQSRQKRHGPNKLREHKARSAWSILVAQFRSLIILLLALAVVAAFLFGEFLEGGAILVVIILNSALGFAAELRAARSMEALFRLGNVETRVRRAGNIQQILASELVPGDVVILEGGDIVTADIRITQSSKLQADESALTGESVPVGKQTAPVDAKTPLAERSSMLFKGTAITSGAGEGIVVATGLATQLGQISSLIEETEDETTPLEKRLDQLAHKLIGVTIFIAALVTLSGVLGGKPVFLMIETGLALAVAAIPEGLPIVATLALARGLWLMAQRNALITRLSSVETLGSTSVICVDKTGTLTENRMTVVRLALAKGDVEIGSRGTFKLGSDPVDPDRQPELLMALETGVLCNNAALVNGGQHGVGDPLESALLIAGTKAGLHREELHRQYPEVFEVAFDLDLRAMATVHETGGSYRVAVKGAPEAVLAASETELTDVGVVALDEPTRRLWLERNERLAEGGLRVLAFATKTTQDREAEPYEKLTFIGLVGLVDPPREDVRAAIDQCRSAGIQVVMITGDQPATARRIAEAVGLTDGPDPEVIHGADMPDLTAITEAERRRLCKTPIFARVSPKQKLDLIRLHQDSGNIVAMTGDGVNDAPALKKADIGIAMGLRGTQVAREAADMVLQDDAFSTIVVAVEHGRIIFGNIRRFVFYLLSCNVSEVMVVGVAALVSATLPILPLQILFLNLVTDVFPALALGMGKSETGVMDQSPRDSQEPVLEKRHWAGIILYSMMITASVLGAFQIALSWLELETSRAVTVSFLTLALAQLWHVFNMRSRESRFLRNEITRNPYVWGALGLCVLLVLGAVYVPGLSDVLRVTHPSLSEWVLILVMSLLPFGAGQVYKGIGKG